MPGTLQGKAHAAQAGSGAENLTQFEFLALNSEFNIADGHARQPLTPGQSKIVNDLPLLFEEGEKRPVEELEREAHAAFFKSLGQHRYPTAPGRVLSCYSSSVAMEIVSRALACAIDSVALVHPTFDNIADLLRGNGLKLVPLEEDPLHGDDLAPSLLKSVGCVFVTTPNNPTGRVMSAERLRRLAEQCAEYGVVLALDTSFRGFDTRAHYDHYEILDASGVSWVVIEDTGKLWPTLDLKVGMLVRSENLGLPVGKIYSDILLGVSPLILGMVRRFSEDAAAGGLAELHTFIAAQRAVVRSELAGLPTVGVPDPDSRASVERVLLKHMTGTQAWEALREHNIYALPCRPFYWADQARGDRTLRLALARASAPLTQCVRTLRHVLTPR
ncbi:enduracididine biosynthesis enzyme MppP [Streptomyces sp. NBC_00576]|uniref:enduracididine biosynthesis enzyme MppP n=1 Tax=Streptomyces sp. NBC_00576 TaxID=2903665 RepID=UPI002E80DB77|nr:enduracididine biosynthesis enzyme MppP [Streptomyces sp. NBC_00576]WUB68689.1 enduracididine biosynthesis enzyme MppP [Streptomyces sp. NBC_00576]WUB77007.1 enduracididine biosynthesis enzyme MppP [Streptomyces sp. NBC_00576]